MEKCISKTIAEELAEELASGRWKAGERLPSVDELRKRFGAGEYAVRHAIKRLADSGAISVKKHVGAVVTAKPAYSWKGRVAFVAVGAMGSYFQQMMSIRFAQVFESAGWQLVTVALENGKDGSIDVEPLCRHLSGGFDFAIGLFGERQVAELLDRAGVPYVILNGFTRDFPNARAVIREDSRECFSRLIAALKKRGARRLVEFDMPRSIDRTFKRQLFEAGISVERVMCKWDNELKWTLGDLKACGHRAVAAYFADERHRRRPPDVVLFDDDYLAAGGIVALFEAGFRIPDDIGVVCHTNRGNELALGVSVARFVNDPMSYADAVAAYVVAQLEGRRAALPKISWSFVDGESIGRHKK
ncbi:MAG: GntR family transcriptional regulator [Kiritimatiellae bacterium]|nr:GntR family transcriptional regulator [Kiritimatiellia bacterium]